MSVKNLKLYCVEFNNKRTSDSFQKIGVTSCFDVENRFKKDEYEGWDIHVLASAYGPSALVCSMEKLLLKKFPKNLYIPESFSGITETVKLSTDERKYVLQVIHTKKQQWYNQRQR